VTDAFALGDKTEERVWLTEFILSEMQVLHDKLPVRALVESEAQPGAWTEVELLRDAARKDETTRTERAADGVTVVVNVKDTLRLVESVEASVTKENPLPLFICYAHANERTVRHLIPSLKVLASLQHARVILRELCGPSSLRLAGLYWTTYGQCFESSAGSGTVPIS